MRTRLDRLVKDGKVVGYQKQEGGKIYHTDEIILDVSAVWVDIKENCCHAQFECTGTGIYIGHDRIDQYTGVDVDGVKVFERDEGIIGGEAFTVKFINGSWSMITKRPRVDFIQDLYRNIKHAQITGIN